MKWLLLGMLFAAPSLAQTQCGAPTPRDMEGPFYKAGAPLRDSLVEPGAAAERLVLSGRVLGADCSPVAGATLDFWHADEKGDYDNEGFRYRGRALTTQLYFAQDVPERLRALALKPLREDDGLRATFDFVL